MRYFLAALCVFALCGVVHAENPAAQVADVGATIDRGLAFLVKDAHAWRETHNCVSCHHASLVIWSLREAKYRGHAVDEPALADLTKWVAESGDGKTSLPRPEGIPKALNEKAVSLALALGIDREPDDLSREGLKRLLATVIDDQNENGKWAAWPETRPPIFGDADERATLSAVLALLPAAAAGDEAALAARDKGVQWLTDTKSDDDPQSTALRLVLWQRLGRPAEQWEPLAARILSRQNADGGWSQTAEMHSDAWATGQALYALAHAGLNSANPAISRGQTFLMKTQEADGSWPMTSRPTKPGGEGSTSLIPIVGAGSAWAVIGLARSE